MKQPRLEHHPLRLWISVLLGILCGSMFLFTYTLTGSTTLDGIIGVLLGLYIGSHPAARLLDLLYLQSGTRRMDGDAYRPDRRWCGHETLGGDDNLGCCNSSA